jgi:hypothetical protein
MEADVSFGNMSMVMNPNTGSWPRKDHRSWLKADCHSVTHHIIIQKLSPKRRIFTPLLSRENSISKFCLIQLFLNLQSHGRNTYQSEVQQSNRYLLWPSIYIPLLYIYFIFRCDRIRRERLLKSPVLPSACLYA